MKPGAFLPTVWLCFAALCALVGCFATGLQRPAPFIHYGGAEGAGATGMHTVGEGENLYAVATRYRLALQDIVAENGLSAPFRLKAGQRLKLPAPREYKVREGDSLYEISRLFDAGASDIVRLNGLSPPYAVREGQVLRLPSPASGGEAMADRLSAPVPSRKPGFAMAARREERGAAAGRYAESLPREDNRFAGMLSRLLGQSAAPPAPEGKPGLRQASAAVPAKIPPPPPRAAGKFLWPVKGKLVSGYGPKRGGLHNDGLNIGAPRGTAVKAADNGVVVYAGNELQGYGNLVLIRHEGRWMTAYAHMDKVSVKKGGVVKKGQTIGAVGSTGSVDSPQLHFEVRRGSDALNPQAFLE